MKSRIFALVDCNNFFASCERVFQPALYSKPIVVLSNNDGCIIARFKEAKALGIPMGAPVHEWQSVINQNDVKIFSANFSLYGDLSNRVMTILKSFAPDIQVYSIDEAFLDLSKVYIKDYQSFGTNISKEVFRKVNIPVSVGIARTKTLAKVAIEKAKKEGIKCFALFDENEIDNVLKDLDVSEIWGIGRNLKTSLNKNGIYTAYDFKHCDERWVRSAFGVSVQRTQFELRGINCIEGVENKEVKKSIISSRSFGRKISSFDELSESVSEYANRACEKLRKQSSLCNYVGVTIVTSKDKETGKYQYFYEGTGLELPTSYSPEVIKAALVCLKKIYRKGLLYKKSMIMLGGIIPGSEYKIGLFSEGHDTAKQSKVMQAFDTINLKLGKITFASTGIEQAWKAKSEKRSPRYTTSWEELPVAKC